MQVKENPARDILRLIVWYPLRWIILIIPIWAGILLLRLMGDIHFLLSSEKKRLLFDNLCHIVGDDRSPQIVKEFFRNYYIDRLFIFIFPKFGRKAIERYIEFEGIDCLDEALKKGKGAILIHGHFGPVHLPLVALARLGYGMKQIGLPSDEGLSWVGKNVSFRLRLKYERMIPAEIIKADGFLRSAFKWLKDNNGVLMITGDGSGTKSRLGKHDSFLLFNKKVLFPLGPAIMAQKTGASLLPLFILPSEKKLYKIIIEKPFQTDFNGEKGIKDLSSQFVQRYQFHIKQYPCYMHFLDRFSSGKLIQGSN